MASETHTKRVVSAEEVPPRLRKKILAQEKSDRLNRKNFIISLLFVNIGGGIVLFIIGTIVGFISTTLSNIIIGLGVIIIGLANLIATAMRCHDFNKSGWMLLLLLVPYLNILVFLYILLKKGTVGDNNYGRPDD